MRVLLAGQGILFAALLAAEPAAAQLQREHDAVTLRSFHGPSSRIRRSFQTDPEARAVLIQVLEAAGLAGVAPPRRRAQ